VQQPKYKPTIILYWARGSRSYMPS